MTTLTLTLRKDNLPAEVTTFIGRRRELAAVAAAIGKYRLVTLRGAGGVGKTRLALRAAGLVRDSFADGCWLVELSALRDPELLPRTVSAALGLPDKAAGDPLAVLAGALADQEMLLVLDTCEHLVEACARLARRLLRAAPGLRILTTSREPLGVADEHTLAITPLEDSEAVALFTDRARAAVPGFELTTANTGPVVQLCRRLDGIALALELAAVRLRSMPVEEILARVADRFRILGTARTSLDRHRTLRAAISWSHELCTPEERLLWAELSVFPGSFDRDAAEHVCGPAAGQALTRLAEKSIVGYDEAAGRYQLLDTMREFAAERLAAERRRPAAGPPPRLLPRAGRAGRGRQPYPRAGRLAGPARAGDGQPAGGARLLVRHAGAGDGRPAGDHRLADLLADGRAVHRGQALAQAGDEPSAWGHRTTRGPRSGPASSRCSRAT